MRKYDEVTLAPSYDTIMSRMNNEADLPPFIFNMVDWSEYEGKIGIADQNIGPLNGENIGIYFVQDSKEESGGKLERKGFAILFKD